MYTILSNVYRFKMSSTTSLSSLPPRAAPYRTNSGPPRSYGDKFKTPEPVASKVDVTSMTDFPSLSKGMTATVATNTVVVPTISWAHTAKEAHCREEARLKAERLAELEQAEHKRKEALYTTSIHRIGALSLHPTYVDGRQHHNQEDDEEDEECSNNSNSNSNSNNNNSGYCPDRYTEGRQGTPLYGRYDHLEEGQGSDNDEWV